MGRPGLVEGTRELVEPPYIIVYMVDEPADEMLCLPSFMVRGIARVRSDVKPSLLPRIGRLVA